MSLLVKAALGSAVVVGVSSIVVVKVLNGANPSWRPLVYDGEFWSGEGDKETVSSDFSSGYGANYAGLLFGVGSAKKGTDKWVDNEDQWNRVLRDRYDDAKFQGGFAKEIVRRKTEGYDSFKGKSLQEACKQAYKGSGGGDFISSGAQTYKEEDIWILCSPVGKKPKLVSEVDGEKYEDGTIGEKMKGELLSITSGDNEGVWKVLQARFRDENPDEGFFMNWVYNSVKDICKAAYKLKDFASKEDDKEKPTEKSLYKWCSPRGYKPAPKQEPNVPKP